jgi:hypothetical protein
MILSRFKLIVIFLTAMILCACLSSCKRSTTYPSEMENLGVLKNSLDNAGVNIQVGDETSLDHFDILGQILFINQGAVEVYEFSGLKEREAVSRNISAAGMVVDGKLIPWERKPVVWGLGSLIVFYRGYDGGIILLLSGLMGDPLTYEAPAEDEPYPPPVVAAIRSLADHLQVDPGSIQVLDFTSVEWSDSCFEAPKPEEECSQELTPGWRVMMKVSDEVYEVRTDQMGEYVRQLD